MSQSVRIPFYSFAPAHLKAMINLSDTVKRGSLGARLVELVQLRVSQINGCGFCVDMHWRDLVRQEVDHRHLNAVVVWREAPFFSARERAALDWAEAVNAIPVAKPSDAQFAALKEQFDETEIAELTYAVIAIRGWNSLSISFGKPIPETPLPGM